MQPYIEYHTALQFGSRPESFGELRSVPSFAMFHRNQRF